MTDYYRGDTISRYFYFKDKDGAAMDPDSTSCKIYDPANTEMATVTLTKVETGKYQMDYSIPADATYGVWKIIVQGIKGSWKRTYVSLFTVKEA